MDNKIKYLVMFFMDISFCTNQVINVNDQEFQELLQGFIINKYNSNKDIMNKVFDISKKDKVINIRINYEEAVRYGQLYSLHPIRFSKLLDDVGEKDLNKILDLAQLFIGYVKEIDEMNECRVRNVRRKRI